MDVSCQLRNMRLEAMGFWRALIASILVLLATTAVLLPVLVVVEFMFFPEDRHVWNAISDDPSRFFGRLALPVALISLLAALFHIKRR